MAQVCDALHAHHLGVHVSLFKRHNINGATLKLLDMEDLEALGFQP